MKKTVLILILCLAMLFITSCSNETVVPATTTEETTFNLDKIRFSWDLFDANDEYSDYGRINVERVSRYFVDEQGKGGCKDQQSMLTAIYVYLNEYRGYYFEISYKDGFDETTLGNMLSNVEVKNDENLYYHIRCDDVQNFDIEIIKSLSNNPKVNNIIFYPPLVYSH